MKDMEAEGKTVAEAVENALKGSGLRRDQVEVQILKEGSSGFMGIGAKPAHVRLTEKRWAADGSPLPPEAPAAPQAPRTTKAPAKAPVAREPRHDSARAPQRPRTERYAPPERAEPRRSRPAPPVHRTERKPAPAPSQPREYDVLTPEARTKACEQAAAFLKDILPLMDFGQVPVSATWDAEQERIKASVETSESERLIGRDGKTLESLQFILTLILTRRFNSPIAVWVDTQGYWDKKEKALLAEAQKGVEEVKATKRPYRMEPMEAPLRRLIHRSLANNPDVVTASEGEGSWRKIVLKPRKG